MAELSSPEDENDAVTSDASDHEVPGDAGDVEMVAAGDGGDHEVPGDAGEMDPDISNISVKEVMSFELKCELNGVVIKKQFNGVFHRADNLTFVNVDCRDMTAWIQSHATSSDDDKPKDSKSKLQGFTALREARDTLTFRMQAGWEPTHLPNRQPSHYVLKSMKKKGSIRCLGDDVILKVKVCGLAIRVLPKRSNVQCWVCTDDLPNVLKIVKRMGATMDDKPPKGIYKRVCKKNASGYAFLVKLNGKTISCKTAEEAIEKLNQL
jgi:hypothetical protein